MKAKLRLYINYKYTYDAIPDDIFCQEVRHKILIHGVQDGWSKDNEYEVIAIVKREELEDLYVLVRFDGQTISVPRGWIELKEDEPSVFNLKDMAHGHVY